MYKFNNKHKNIMKNQCYRSQNKCNKYIKASVTHKKIWPLPFLLKILSYYHFLLSHTEIICFYQSKFLIYRSDYLHYTKEFTY